MPNSSTMSDPVLHILLALSDHARHGYAIVQEIEVRTGGAVRLGTGTLYTALKRLRKDGLIKEVVGASVPAGGRKRRIYGLTPHGRATLDRQTARLKVLFEHALQKSAFVDPVRP